MHHEVQPEALRRRGRDCGLRTDAPEAKPDPHEDLRVHKVHCDNLILLHALALEPVAIAEHHIVSLGICPRLSLEYDPGVICARRGFGMRLEFVEEIQGVASFLQRAGDAAANEGRK